MSGPSQLLPLRGHQQRASDPQAHIWLSASAGTGKTQVLMARVLRLLLRGVRPEAILCLTFTKAGAAEMAERVNARLAAWVQMDGPALAGDLMALGEDHGPQMQDHARRLFAQVLDATGGLRIQTIHGFCQTLLASFPLEAGLVPGFRPLEEREQRALAHQALADLLVEAQGRGDSELIGAMQALSLRMGEDGAVRYLTQCGGQGEALADLPLLIGPWLRDQLDLPQGDVEAAIAARCDDATFDIASLRRLAAANAGWGTATGLNSADAIAAWLGASPQVRATMLESLVSLFRTAKGEPKKVGAKLEALEPAYADLAERVGSTCAELIALRARAAYADLFAQALHAGRAFAAAYAEAKRLAGAVDFDDLIRRAVALLLEDGMGQWIRYKLDQATDHILVDEAQDTNAHQWTIVAALAAEFFVGEGAAGERLRTIFTVGDFKQAIFGFQGTSPEAFRYAAMKFEQRALEGDQFIDALSLDESFRSTPPILDVVDGTIAELGWPALGLAEPPPPHVSAVPHPGEVLLWPPVFETDEGVDEGEEDWAGGAELKLARQIAQRIRGWIASGMALRSKGRPIRAGDVMILVRRRSDLARLIVARLYEEGVPVAGIDRLRLNAPLAVQDLLAALRFALQPRDDLNLANLLVSPLVGWSQDELYRRGKRPPGTGLWDHLTSHAADELAPLRTLLAKADLTTPYRYLEQILSGPMDGRRRLIERLGREARDPIDELLNTALAFEREGHVSLQLFVDWFDRGDVEIVRDAAAQGDSVRVLTVHGAKGLQAPLVILADATVDPRMMGGQRGFSWNGLPVVPPRKAERAGPMADAAEEQDRLDLQEHWRLLYVALTRAEERLVVAGALGPRAKGVTPQSSWHRAVEAGMRSLGAEPLEDGALCYRGSKPLAPKTAPKAESGADEAVPPLPEWVRLAAPVEARPPRPLAPSAQIEDDGADPPPGPAMRAAAERGRCLHALYERLPAVAPPERRAAADRWLERNADMTDAVLRAALIDDALSVIEHPDFADLFAPDALAEAPIAAIVGEEVISGTVDRLCVGAEVVKVVDFKTGRRVPGGADAISVPHLRQMAAYVAALQVIFPGRRVEAGLLYTSGPALFPLPDRLLDPHKPGYVRAQHNL